MYLRQIPADILEKMIYSSTITADDFTDEAKVDAWAKDLITQLENQDGNGSIYKIEVKHNQERNIYYPNFIVRKHGIDTEYQCSYEFIAIKRVCCNHVFK